MQKCFLNIKSCSFPRTSTSIKKYYKYKNIFYRKCNKCDLVFQYPIPKEKETFNFYKGKYFILHESRKKLRLKQYKLDKKILNNFFKDSHNTKVLDYGCGNGDFLYYVSKKHPQCKFFGYEISEKSEIIKSENVLIIKGSINLLLEKLPICKIITMNHTIEHIPQPDLIIKKLFEKLDNLGFIDGQTPSTQSVEKFLFKNYWSGFHAPRHTVIFSIKGITQIFLNVGFKEIVIKSAFNPASYAVSIGSVIKKNKNLLKREGLRWFALICIGSFLSFIDILFKKPNIINFKAVKYNNDKDGRF